MFRVCVCVFFFNDTATTEIYTLSLHDALPISQHRSSRRAAGSIPPSKRAAAGRWDSVPRRSSCSPQTFRSSMRVRSEEHTSELQSRQYLVCRLLLEKKKNTSSTYLLHIYTLFK